MKKSLLSLALLALSLAAPAQQEKTPAFPGAEGFGRYTAGGRGGKVFHVTNLDDSGEGSLRWALGQSGKKTIVFDVSGTIHLESALNIGSYTTIAGQTAPGDGICVADYPCSIKGGNVIVRYMRFRLGNKYVLKDGADGWDGFGGFDQQDIIIDHCSVSWSIDECLSVLGNKNTTVQWCLVAQSLVNSGHSKGSHGYGGNWGGSGASFHHNLIAHHASRTPRLGPRPTTQLDERMDMRNNVIYNFGGNGCYGGEGMTVNIVNNYYKPGPGSPSGNKGKRIAGIGIRTNEYVNTYPAYAPALHIWGKFYVTGNVNPQYSDVTKDNWTIGVINQVTASDCDGTWTQATRDSIKLAEPMPYVLTTTHTAEQGYERVLSYAGASLSRDAFDELMVSDTRNGVATYTGSGLGKGFVNSQDDNKPANATADWSAWPTLTSKAAKKDTDGDGIPDAWESENGLNPNDPADGNQLTAEGYTNLEVYLNSLVASITAAQNADGTQSGYTIENNDANEQPDEGTAAWYSIQNNDDNVGSDLSITDVKGITLTFDSADWTVGGSQSSATTVDGVDLTGKYATTTSNGNSVFFSTRQAGTLTIFFGGGIATNKAVHMTLGDTGLTGTVLSTGAQIESGSAPAQEVKAWDGISYTLSAGNTYAFKATGTKWRLAGFKFTIDPTGISPLSVDRLTGKVYNLHGQQVSQPQRGIYIVNGKKTLMK